MKSILMALSLFSATAFAAPVCVNVPDTVQATVKPNFDGSFSYASPKLLLGGVFVYVAAGSDEGFCAVVGKKVVDVVQTEYVSLGSKIIALQTDGKFSDAWVTNSSNYNTALKEVVCQ